MAPTDKGFISPKFRENEASVRRGCFLDIFTNLKIVLGSEIGQKPISGLKN